MSIVCTQETTACFMSASVTNRLRGVCFFMDVQRWKSAGLILPTGLRIDCGVRDGRWQTTFLTSMISLPGNFNLFKSLEKHLAGKRFATDADVKHVVTLCLQTLYIKFFYSGIETMGHTVVQKLLCLKCIICYPYPMYISKIQ